MSRHSDADRNGRSSSDRKLAFSAIALTAILIGACGGGDSSQPTATGELAPTESAAVDVPTEVVETPETTPTPTPERLIRIPTPTSTPEVDVAPTVVFEDEVERARAAQLQNVWRWDTNFAERNIHLTEVNVVLPRDRITPIDEPTFASVAEAPTYMKPREPVVSVVIDGDARAYPLAILMWHEIVNDTVGDLPVTVTFCPLCNTGITFERVIDGEELTFGTSGMLRNSDLVMWDRQTQSWWQQITGEALVGDYAADETVLEFVPSAIIAWETFASSYPDGLVLERIFDERGLPARSYDSPPYGGYDNIDEQPFLFTGEVDGRLIATSRVLTLDAEVPVAYPFSFLKENPVLNDRVDDADLVAFFDDGTLSAFDDALRREQTAGSTTVFSRVVGGRSLTFELTDSVIVDTETASTWSLTGSAVSGALEGTQLEPIVHANHFWFAWAVFKPETVVRDSLDSLGG